MKWVLIAIANFLCLVTTTSLEAATCQQHARGVQVCAPNGDWHRVGDDDDRKQLPGSVWLHRERQGKQLHSFVAIPDREPLSGSMEAYVHYAVEQFREREFIVAERQKLANQIELIKFATPDQKTFFYQGYAQGKDKTVWGFNCMGPNQKVVNTDCPKFMQNIRM